MKTYAFPVVIEEDRFEDGRKAYHAYCNALRYTHNPPSVNRAFEIPEARLGIVASNG